MKQWNVLVVDDDKEIAELVSQLISGQKVLKGDDQIVCHIQPSFDAAISLLETSRFDLLILDLKDDKTDAHAGDDEDLAGERVLAALRRIRFAPVVFHTGYTHKVARLASPFVRVVTKADNEILRQEVSSIFSTGLPQLMRFIEEQQRSYLWDHIEERWKDTKICEDNDLAYLAARRLGAALSAESIRQIVSPQSPDRIRPVELYVWPPMPEQILFGDIVKVTGSDRYKVVLSPSCDCVNGKVEDVLVADCQHAASMTEYTSARQEQKDGSEVSKGKKNELMAMIRDRRAGKGVQPERYKFLPGTSFMPDLLVDLQQLSRVRFEDLMDAGKYSRVATIDSPFSQALQNRFTQYYGRVGTPDLDADLVLERMLK